jgi:hypothetical protein
MADHSTRSADDFVLIKRSRPVVTRENFLKTSASHRMHLVYDPNLWQSSVCDTQSAPRSRLEQFARVIVGDRIAHSQIEPCIADMQHERFEALQRNDRRAAWFAVVRGTATVIAHVVRNISGEGLRRPRHFISAMNMPERFSKTSHVLSRAAYEHAMQLHRDHVGEDVLMLAMLNDESMRTALEQRGVDLERLQAAVTQRVDSREREPVDPVMLALDSGLGRIWEDAHLEANARQSYLVEPGDLLGAISRGTEWRSRVAQDLLASGFRRQD